MLSHALNLSLSLFCLGDSVVLPTAQYETYSSQPSPMSGSANTYNIIIATISLNKIFTRIKPGSVILDVFLLFSDGFTTVTQYFIIIGST